MNLNFLGLIAAPTAFLSIWLGHVAVRKIESTSRAIAPPIILFLLLGLMTEYWSLTTANRQPATALGILGVTLLWDALEIYRQQKRVQRGHAPANPNNPRHASILAEYSSATTQDLLKREPHS